MLATQIIEQYDVVFFLITQKLKNCVVLSKLLCCIALNCIVCIVLSHLDSFVQLLLLIQVTCMYAGMQHHAIVL